MRWLALVIVLAGCASSPPSQFYTLSATAAPELAPAARTEYRIVVGPATVPDAVDRPQLVVRMSENRVTLVEQARWAEPLSSAIPAVIAEDLGRLLSSSGVVAYPQGSADFDYQVLIEVLRFDSVPDDAATVEIAWTLRAPDGARRHGRTLVRERVDGAGYEALAAAHSRALRAVSAEIADAIRQRANSVDSLDRQPEQVARAALRADIARLGRIAFDLAPQAHHLHVDGAIEDLVVVQA